MKSRPDHRAIDEIRDIRHRISEWFGHDPAKLIAHYIDLQERHRDRLLHTSCGVQGEMGMSADLPKNQDWAMSAEKLLSQVKDRDSFIAFVTALAEERDRAAEIERSAPGSYEFIDGALEWRTADVGSYLYGCLEYFEDGVFHRPEPAPSWKMFADFLYFGKTSE